MTRVIAVWISIAISGAAGICCAELAARSVALRDKFGTVCGRGHLLALVHGHGIYQADVDGALAAAHYPTGAADHSEGISAEGQSALTNLIANAALQSRAEGERISRADVKRELNLLRSQFRDDKTWGQALHESGLFTLSLWLTLRNDLGSRQWILDRIGRQIDVTEDECRRFYESHPENFFVPERLRVSHLFLAAPAETALEIVEAKRTAIEALSVRLAGGEDFAALTAENSEDEATKLGGGDLGYFSASRMLPDFVAAALKLRPGGISKPIRTRLGFHILKLIDVQQARQKTFDKARDDIAIELANQKRATAIQQLIVDLGSQADYLRPL
ncbi:MAG TPA: peptidyl-prolyl cis-trans isomerase [Chthoniobacterales bacterium]|nr:peptidyl-prolyl cis-trans isomerase [Chthoniobacterales bacterium]